MYNRFALLFILLAINLPAQTEVSGSVNGFWSSRDSPYQLTADVLVASGDTLIIQSNVVVDLGSQYTLRVEGLMTATDASMENGGGLFAAGGRLVLSGCDFYGLTSGLKVFGGTAEIDDCLIDSTAETGVTFNGADSSFLHNSLIMNSGDYGVKIRATDNVEIIGNTFTGNSTNDVNHPALFIDSASPEIIENNIIEDNHAQGLGVWSLSSTAFPIIRYNIIRRNFTGITLVNSPAIIEGNIIVANFVENNTNSGAGIYAGFENSTPIIINNYIAGNYYGVSNINAANCNLGNPINFDHEDDGLNVFFNNTVDGQTWNIWNSTTNQLTAQNNYWPGLNLNDIDATLWDNEEGGGLILFEPVATPVLPDAGDLNDDSLVNILDIVLVVEGILANDVPDAVFFYLADLNTDYSVDVNDVVMILEMVVGQ